MDFVQFLLTSPAQDGKCKDKDFMGNILSMIKKNKKHRKHRIHG